MLSQDAAVCSACVSRIHANIFAQSHYSPYIHQHQLSCLPSRYFAGIMGNPLWFVDGGAYKCSGHFFHAEYLNEYTYMTMRMRKFHLGRTQTHGYHYISVSGPVCTEVSCERCVVVSRRWQVVMLNGSVHVNHDNKGKKTTNFSNQMLAEINRFRSSFGKWTQNMCVQWNARRRS